MADQTLSQIQSGGSLGFNLGQMAGVIPSTAKLASSAGLGGVYQAASSLPSIGGTLFGSAIPAGELAAAGTLGGIGPTTAAGAGGLSGWPDCPSRPRSRRHKDSHSASVRRTG